MSKYINQNDYVFDDMFADGLDSLPINSRIRVEDNTYVLVKSPPAPFITIKEAIEQGYIRSLKSSTKATYQGIVSNNTNCKILNTRGANNSYYGKLKIRTYESGVVTSYFEITVHNDSALFNFSIDVANYYQNGVDGRTIFQSNSLSSTSMILFLGWCFYYDGNYFGVCVENNANIKYFEVDYSDIDILQPNDTFPIDLTNMPFNNTKYIYAPRKGGGTQIQNLGVKYESLRKTYTGMYSYDFYKFTNGFLELNSAMSIDINKYPQYLGDDFHSIGGDPAGLFSRNIGGNASSNPGEVQEAQLPEIEGDVGDRQIMFLDSGTSTGCFSSSSSTVAYVLSGSGSVGIFNKKGFKFNASNSNSIYTDGGEVRPKTMCFRWFIVVY